MGKTAVTVSFAENGYYLQGGLYDEQDADECVINTVDAFFVAVLNKNADDNWMIVSSDGFLPDAAYNIEFWTPDAVLAYLEGVQQCEYVVVSDFLDCEYDDDGYLITD